MEDKKRKYVYEVCCDICGVKHGTIAFNAPRPGWDPRAAGIRCAGCWPSVGEGS